MSVPTSSIKNDVAFFDFEDGYLLHDRLMRPTGGGHTSSTQGY